ncbi:hypothetical protein WICMUC_001583 [Wickerhamomyces mucosus]|uniref:Uncharacterized protein n=1 Tax=Wickerhamomyces mucosus TaxID=1378264 RepID=A0A9P8TH15_9ASCO|nr:hypothetical protein WICMUC_001583 [Wickerhamomyces mucosus]
MLSPTKANFKASPSITTPKLPSGGLYLSSKVETISNGLSAIVSTSSPEVFKTSSSISLPNRLQENPMLIAVSTLSPVKTHNFMPALLKSAIESGTPS